jgi:hypothetical protein
MGLIVEGVEVLNQQADPLCEGAGSTLTMTRSRSRFWEGSVRFL